VSLGPELERSLLKQLEVEWGHLNRDRLKRAMVPPVLELADAQHILGRWQRLSRTLALSREFATTAPWGHVVEVLKHEMAHQYADEVLGATDERAHGPAFRRACERLGVDSRAGGALTEHATPERSSALRRIRKLLALASSDNQHEAEAAMNRAQKLMLEHNISLGHDAEHRYEFREIGPSRKRFAGWEKLLAGLLAQRFFVRVVWVQTFIRERGTTGRTLEINGSPENVAFAAHAHDYLRYTAGRLWREHKQRLGLRSDANRQRFLAGVMVGFSSKLEQQADVCEQAGLVWVPDASLEDHVARRHPRLRRGRRVRIGGSGGYAEGREAGRGIELNRPVSSTSPTGRALPGPTE